MSRTLLWSCSRVPTSSKPTWICLSHKQFPMKSRRDKNEAPTTEDLSQTQTWIRSRVMERGQLLKGQVQMIRLKDLTTSKSQTSIEGWPASILNTSWSRFKRRRLQTTWKGHLTRCSLMRLKTVLNKQYWSLKILDSHQVLPPTWRALVHLRLPAISKPKSQTRTISRITMIDYSWKRKLRKWTGMEGMEEIAIRRIISILLQHEECFTDPNYFFLLFLTQHFLSNF